jgi:hypothetical protein
MGKCDKETDEAQVFRLSGFISDNGRSPGVQFGSTNAGEWQLA